MKTIKMEMPVRQLVRDLKTTLDTGIYNVREEIGWISKYWN